MAEATNEDDDTTSLLLSSLLSHRSSFLLLHHGAGTGTARQKNIEDRQQAGRRATE